MLKKSFHHLNDGLGTVSINLELPDKRLDDIQRIADFNERSVDTIIGDAILEYLVKHTKNSSHESISDLRQAVDYLQQENTALRIIAERLSKPKKPYGKRLRKSESSALQIYLPMSEIPLALPLSSAIGVMAV